MYYGGVAQNVKVHMYKKTIKNNTFIINLKLSDLFIHYWQACLEPYRYRNIPSVKLSQLDDFQKLNFVNES